MKDSEKEAIKLRANYINGIALIFMGVGAIGPLYLAAQSFQWLKVLVVGALAIGAILSSIDLHWQAQKQLRKLDED